MRPRKFFKLPQFGMTLLVVLAYAIAALLILYVIITT